MTTRHEFLTALHERLEPRGYLEIGINTGRSLTLSRTRTVAVDPAFKITEQVHCDVQVVKATSDDFFGRPDALQHLPGGTADLSLIDGLHLFEFALRDFMNAERSSTWTSVIVVDDILPRSVAEASRDRGTMGAWTGDVYKLVHVLRTYRPDLVLLSLDTDPTGVLVVLGADPGSTVLHDHYDEIVAAEVRPDPQQVPVEVLDRAGSLLPSALVDSTVWAELARLRAAGTDREAGLTVIRELVAAASTPAPKRELTPAALRPRPVAPTLSAGTAPGSTAKKAGKKKAGKPPAPQRSRASAGVRRRLRPLVRLVRSRVARRG